MPITLTDLNRLSVTPILVNATETGPGTIHFKKSYVPTQAEPAVFQFTAVMTGSFSGLTILVEYSPDAGTDWESVGTFSPLTNGVGYFPCSEAQTGYYRLNITTFTGGTSVTVYGQIGAPAGSVVQTNVDAHVIVDSGTLTANQGTPGSSTGAWYTRPGSPTTASWLQTPVSFSASGETTLIAGITSQTIRVMRLLLVNSSATTPTSLTLQDTAGSPNIFSGSMLVVQGGNISGDSDGEPLFVTVAGNGFAVNSSAAVQISGVIYYTQS